MQSLFSLDSPIMRAMSRLADLVGLNLLFLLTSIPIFTIGPGLAAMYTVVFRMGTSRERGIVKPYFRAFAANFRQGTVLWLLVLVAVIGTLVDINVLLGLAGALRNLYLLAVALLVLVVMMAGFFFPLISQFQAGLLTTIKNALALSIGYLPRALAIAAVNVLPFFLLLFNPYLFLRVGFVWFFLYFAGAAKVNAMLLQKVFRPYWPQEDAQQAV